MPQPFNAILIRNATATDFGGAERYQIMLAQEIIKHNIQPLIMSAHGQLLNMAEKSQISAIKTAWLAHQNFSGWKIMLFPVYWAWIKFLEANYAKLFREHKPELVHLNSRDDYIAGTKAAKKQGLRVIWTDHADLKHIFTNTSKPIKNPIGKMVLKTSLLADAIMLVSNSERQEILKSVPKNHFFWQKVSIVHNGATDKFTGHQPQKNFIFCMTSRLVRDKGIFETIEAFKSINQKYRKTELWLLGDGNDASELKMAAKSNPSIKFLGHQENPTDFLAKSNCFLQPSYHEGLSLGIVEACMMELPIIATNVGGNPEIVISQKNGLLIDARDSWQLEKAMETIISNPNLAQKLARNARQTYLKKFVFSEIVNQQILPLYRK